ncbi:glycoside hydrolase family 3 C-terminal domain-containing protein [Pelagicoccus sp. NFK12]|uniref:Glycoside hydrolase family 3 C-terminal domain-containing protein n=1 Tax=Pelagicoccus enzymogenes TaxID=2773457 RepID=A0A927FAL6_9BACT|nr:glycoside hydrolase family 3 C-terminal domain-containing protein [Pelagicoccus enzymogenes]MBD5780880.1 glycoside hydrolase family 3 C-terminal domain-containing protein [Pelagicoccus enzymogenes]
MYPKISFEEASAWAEGILSQMTLDEKCDYVGGEDIFYTKAIERLGIKRVMMSDATAGIHLRDRFHEFTYQNPIEKSTAFPCPLQLSATWNPELSQEFAKSVAEQALAAGIGVLLGPGFNIYRHSQCGRNFEYFGEDPFLTSRMIERYIKGAQDTGVVATIKHFVANNTDYFRRKSNSVVDERALNEIYLPAFKAGVEAGVLAAMTSYNLVNGEWAGQSEQVIKGLLRGHLGFKWLVMTDWWSVFDGAKVAKSGQDLEMPACLATVGLADKVRSGEVDEADVNRMVKSILTTLKAMDLFDLEPRQDLVANFPKHEEVALQTAREGTVLLKNDRGILPLVGEQEILLIGDFITNKAHGGGSARVDGYDTVHLLDALVEEFGDRVIYEKAPTWERIAAAERLILSVGTMDSEGWDRPFELGEGDERFARKVMSLNPNVVVLVQSGSGIRMTDWNERAAAIVYCWYNGQNGHTAVAEILSGKTNPSGKLPMTIEREFADSVDPDYVPQGEHLYSSWNDQWETAREVYDIEYEEGVFVGYRWYDSKGIEPLYPFGHGLSYTKFEYSNLQVSKQSFAEDEEVEVSVTVRNAGEVAGSEIVQLYVRDVESSLPRPIKELKGFRKLQLAPGESQAVTFVLRKADFSFWSPEAEDWVAEAGGFELLLGASSRDLRLSARVALVG